MVSDWFLELFHVEKPVIGVIHLPPLPGSSRYRGESVEGIVEFAVSEARKLVEGGVDGLIVENYGDYPFAKRCSSPLTIASMAVVVREVVKEVAVPVGVNLLRNSGPEALAIAYACGAKFIRVNAYTDVLATDQGILEPVAYEIEFLRSYLRNCSVRVFADVHCKHGKPLYPESIEESALVAVSRGCADAVIVTGLRTGCEPSLDDVVRVRSVVSVPVIVGSGMRIDNVARFFRYVDGFIVGTYFKVDGVTTNPVDVERVRKFMNVIRDLRSRCR
ncbi:MAG: hypothetical protein DRJ40_02050 [Thermoprotei archaeon]|nr:MAG: hypothetical protein DRJ40_02050 [Thermoprotei archaeon]